MTVVRVLVFGAGGRMGATVCEAVAADDDLQLVAGVDPGAGGQCDVTGSIDIVASVADIEPAGVDVAVDFTVAAAARENLGWCAANGVHAVVGTSGLDPDDYERCRAAFTSSNCLIAPNFAIGAVLMMRFAELAAPFFPTAEVIELHHDHKVDAPSGTAMQTVRAMAEASDDWGPDPTRDEVVPGARAARGPAAFLFTPSGCGGWLRTSRCCSAQQGRRLRSATTAWTGCRSCQGCYSLAGRSPIIPVSQSASIRTCSSRR